MKRFLCALAVSVMLLAVSPSWSVLQEPVRPPTSIKLWEPLLSDEKTGVYDPTSQRIPRSWQGRSLGVFQTSGGEYELWVILMGGAADPFDGHIVKIAVSHDMAQHIKIGKMVLVMGTISDAQVMPDAQAVPEGVFIELGDGQVLPMW